MHRNVLARRAARNTPSNAYSTDDHASTTSRLNVANGVVATRVRTRSSSSLDDTLRSTTGNLHIDKVSKMASPDKDLAPSATPTPTALTHDTTVKETSKPPVSTLSGNVVAQLASSPKRFNTVPPLNPALVTAPKGVPSVTDKRLAAWRAQPKNLSPAQNYKLEPMIPPPVTECHGKMCLVVDIDETLVHASFTPAKPYNVKVTIEVDGERGDIFVAYRPYMHAFLNAIAPLFEVVVFTASQACYADQLMDAIDPQRKLGGIRLFREHCTEVNGARVKDLSLLGRPLERMAIVDNSPVAYLFQPRNAIPISSWFDDPRDTELLKLIPMLRQLAVAQDVYDVLDPFNASTGSASPLRILRSREHLKEQFDIVWDSRCVDAVAGEAGSGKQSTEESASDVVPR